MYVVSSDFPDWTYMRCSSSVYKTNQIGWNFFSKEDGVVLSAEPAW